MPVPVAEIVVDAEVPADSVVPPEPIVQGEDVAAQVKPPVLMVEVVNLQHEKFKKTEEVKVSVVN